MKGALFLSAILHGIVFAAGSAYISPHSQNLSTKSPISRPVFAVSLAKKSNRATHPTVAPTAAFPPSASDDPSLTAETSPLEEAALLSAPAPHYPFLSRKKGEEGDVKLRVSFWNDGRIESVDLIGSSGYPRLDEAGIEHLSKAQFRALPGPARRLYKELNLSFRLKPRVD